MTGPDDLCYMTALEAAAEIRRGALSPVELMRAVLERIERLNPGLNAYCTVAWDSARAAAEDAERAVTRGGALGKLHGVPVSIKDLILTKGIRTTSGSTRHADFVPEDDAPAVERLKAAGAIVIGKTNTPEFGHKAVTDNALFGPTRNPWNPRYTPGGSSGGAAAAVAAGLGPVAVGTDSGGSIRIPASCCGVFGFKPTLGRVAQAPTFGGLEITNHTGPLTRTVADAALMMEVMAGADSRDMSSLPHGEIGYVDSLDRPIEKLRVAWSPDLGYAPVAGDVRKATAEAVKRFVDLGWRLEEVNPNFDSPEPAFTILTSVTTAARFAETERLEEFPLSLRRWIEEGTRHSGIEFVRAANQRRVLSDALHQLFTRYDLLVTPTLAAPPLPIGVDCYEQIEGQSVSSLGWQAFTIPVSFVGCPAASVPCGSTAEGLPVSLQMVAPRLADELVLRAAAAFESIMPWAHVRPPAPDASQGAPPSGR